jgi:hypothetical protein
VKSIIKNDEDEDEDEDEQGDEEGDLENTTAGERRALMV